MSISDTKNRLDEVKEMIRFRVHLQVDMEREEMEDLGKPDDWNWEKMIDRGVGNVAFSTATLIAVKSGPAFVSEFNDDDDLVNVVVNDDIVQLPTRLEKAFDTVLGLAQDHIADWMQEGGTKEWQSEQLNALRSVREFAREQLLNPDIGDDEYDSLIVEID